VSYDETSLQALRALGLVGESLDLSLLATPGDIKANKERAGLSQTLELYPATKYSP
jgi:hypothetical protein